MSRGGKRMVMWSSDLSSQRTCTPDSFALVVRSTPTRPLANPPQHNETARPTQNQEYTDDRQPELPRRPGTGAARRRVLRRAVRPPRTDGGQDPRGQHPPQDQRRLPAAGRARPTRRARQALPRAGRLPRPGRLSRAGRLPRPGLPAAVLRAAAARRLRPAAAAAATPTRATGRHPAATPAARRPAGLRRAGGDYDYGRQPAPAVRTRAATAARAAAATRTRAATRNRAATPTRAATRSRAATAARLRPPGGTAQPDYGRYGEPPAGGGYAEPGYGEPAGGGYDYGQPAGRPVATAAATARATTRPAAPPSRCSSTTAAAGPTSCARAPT